MKESIKQLLEAIGINITLTTAGFIGSLLTVGKKSAENMRATLIGLFSGTVSANYVSPLVVDFIGLDESAQGGIAFLIGLVGLKGVENLITKYFDKK